MFSHLPTLIGSSVERATVSISVLVPLALVPQQTIYITPGTSVRYLLQTRQRNTEPRTIEMPNAQYLWSTDSPAVASVDPSGTLEALELGYTRVIAQYASLTESNAAANVRVVMPDHLELTIMQADAEGAEGEWDGPAGESGVTTTSTTTSSFLVLGEKYRVRVIVYSGDSHPLYSTSNLMFAMSLPVHYFESVHSARNMESSVVIPREEGVTEITATLEYMVDQRTGQKIYLDHPISAALKVNPILIHLALSADSFFNVCFECFVAFRQYSHLPLGVHYPARHDHSSFCPTALERR